MYTNEYEEYFPAGKATPLESLSLIFDPKGEDVALAICMASHANQPKLGTYYEKHQKIPEDLTCYRYNEGLTEAAPYNAVLMYYYKPIKWENWYTPSNKEGRLMLFVDGHMKFHPEEEFQKMQKATLDWIRENKEKT